ncbi:MAG: hypothetical protein ACXABD_20785 [Candidatus Thorarchaeota archaeon]|jgi:hypothetical protein
MRDEPLPVELEPLPKGVLILQGIDQEAWNEAVANYSFKESRGMLLVQVAQAFRVSPSVIVNLPEDIEDMQERMGNKILDFSILYGAQIAPPCTAHRNSITE